MDMAERKKKDEKAIKREKIRKTVNYILLMIAIILVCLLSLKVYKNYQNSKYQTSVLNKVVANMSIDDLDNAKAELASDDFIIISYTGSKEVRQLEKQIKKNKTTSCLVVFVINNCMHKLGVVANIKSCLRNLVFFGMIPHE